MNNLIEGQINIFLMIFIGEFVRYSLLKKPFLAGLWLGGLLLKPQLLILIIPVILLFRNYKVAHGFIVSTGAIIVTSTILSGLSGMGKLLNIWLAFLGNGPGPAATNMINWRMVGVNINDMFQVSNGWIVTAIGSILTFAAFFLLIKRIPPYGSPIWVMTILGIFSATIAITWHAHFAMALVLVPFMVYGSMNRLIPEKTSLLWIAATPAVQLLMMILSTVIYVLSGDRIDTMGIIWCIVRIVVNLAFVFYIRYSTARLSYR